MPQKSLKIHNLSGKVAGKVNLSPIFFTKPNLTLVSQAVANYQFNLRSRGGHTKDRGQRRGGGRKPWRQKGTGRARVGSIRSPLWRKGGIIFGPKSYKPKRRRLGKCERKLVLASILAQKLIDNEIIIIKNLEIKEYKTKKILEILGNLSLEDSALIVVDEKNEKLSVSARNIPFIKVTQASNLNILDLLTYHYLILTEGSFRKIDKIYGAKND